MARKSKSSKESQENNDAELSDADGASDMAEQAQETNAESNLTEELSEKVDISADAVPDEDVTAETSEASEAADLSTEAGETAQDTESTPDEPAVDSDLAAEDPISTDVAGVVPAQSSEPTPASAPVAAPAPAPAPSAFPLVFGGLAAGAIGFLVATFAVPEGWPNPPQEAPGTDPETIAQIETLAADVGAVSERISALSGDVSAVNSRIDDLPPPVTVETAEGEPVDLSPILDRLAALESENAALRGTISTLEAASTDLSQRVQELADAPTIVAPDGSAAMEAQLESFRRELDAVTEAARAEIEDAQARASQIEAEAAAAAEAAARNAALAEVRAALESGAPFAEALSGLGDAPEALSAVAADGVVPMSDLQDRFPDAARAALQGVQSVPADASATDRFASFLRRHTNARSLAPREGDDPDAILSRAEAALAGGDIAAALEELSALPEDAIGPMASWISDAEARSQAVAAMNEMN